MFRNTLSQPESFILSNYSSFTLVTFNITLLSRTFPPRFYSILHTGRTTFWECQPYLCINQGCFNVQSGYIYPKVFFFLCPQNHCTFRGIHALWDVFIFMCLQIGKSFKILIKILIFNYRYQRNWQSDLASKCFQKQLHDSFFFLGKNVYSNTKSIISITEFQD